jgi:hypothetical protein
MVGSERAFFNFRLLSLNKQSGFSQCLWVQAASEKFVSSLAIARSSPAFCLEVKLFGCER